MTEFLCLGILRDWNDFFAYEMDIFQFSDSFGVVFAIPMQWTRDQEIFLKLPEMFVSAPKIPLFSSNYSRFLIEIQNNPEK